MLSTLSRRASGLLQKANPFSSAFRKTVIPSSTTISPGWFLPGKPLGGLQQEAQFSISSRVSHKKPRREFNDGNVKIYYDEECVEVLKEKLKLLMYYRDKASKSSIPGSYKFIQPGMQTAESKIVRMIINMEFIDKTASYIQALNPLWDDPGVRFACFPRRFGKTTWLLFLEATLGVPETEEDLEARELFYERVADMQNGKEFLDAPLRPIVLLPLYSCHDSEELSTEFIRELEKMGVRVTEGNGKKPEPHTLLRNGVDLLSNLYKEARTQLNAEDKDKVSPLPLILIDEYDAPWRKEQVALVKKRMSTGETKKRADLKAGRYFDLTESIVDICDVLKRQTQENLIYGAGIVSLIPLGGTGLSKLQFSKNLGAYAEHHTLFGISQTELEKCLTQAKPEDPLNWEKALEWTRQLGILKPLGENPTEEKKKNALLEYFERNINGFCTAVLNRKEGQTFDPLYSPLDILQIMKDIVGIEVIKQNPNYKKPQLLWVQQARDSFSDLIRESGHYEEAVMAFLGGQVPVSELDTVANMTEQFRAGANMKHLLYHLGLLRVANVSGDEIASLAPVLEGRPREVMRILEGAYAKTEMKKLTDDEVEEYRSNLPKLGEDMFTQFPRAIEALAAMYGPMKEDVMREEAVQDRIYQSLQAYLIHNSIYLGKEMQMTESKHALDVLFAIKGARLPYDKVYGKNQKRDAKHVDGEAQLLPRSFNHHIIDGFVVEMKVERATDKKNKMLEALNQALGYRRKLDVEAEHVWLMGVVCSWKADRNLRVTCWFGKFDVDEGKELTEDDLKNDTTIVKREYDTAA